ADAHIAVAQLDVHGLHLIGGEDGALHRPALALLKEEAAPVLAVAHGKAPVPGLPVLAALLGLLVLLVLSLGVLPVVVIVLDKVDVDIALKAVGILLPELLRHIPDDDLGLAHGVLGLGDGLPDHILGGFDQVAKIVPAGVLLAGQLPVGAQRAQVLQQLVHIPQVVQGLLVGFL